MQAGYKCLQLMIKFFDFVRAHSLLGAKCVNGAFGTGQPGFHIRKTNDLRHSFHEGTISGSNSVKLCRQRFNRIPLFIYKAVAKRRSHSESRIDCCAPPEADQDSFDSIFNEMPKEEP